MSEWISVEDRLPETGFLPIEECSLTVLVWTTECTDSWDAELGYYCDWGAWKVIGGNGEETVTHWQPLPEAPK